MSEKRPRGRPKKEEERGLKVVCYRADKTHIQRLNTMVDEFVDRGERITRSELQNAIIEHALAQGPEYCINALLFG